MLSFVVFVVRCVPLLDALGVCSRWCCLLLCLAVVVAVRCWCLLCVVGTVACCVLVCVCHCLALIVVCCCVCVVVDGRSSSLFAVAVWYRLLMLLSEVAVLVA